MGLLLGLQSAYILISRLGKCRKLWPSPGSLDRNVLVYDMNKKPDLISVLFIVIGLGIAVNVAAQAMGL